MTCENEASPSINSASPGAAGSTETAAIVGDDADRSTTTTLALRAISRASVNAVRVMLSLDAVPRIVTLRAASPALRKILGELLDFGEIGLDPARSDDGSERCPGSADCARRGSGVQTANRAQRPRTGAVQARTQPPREARSCAAIRR